MVRKTIETAADGAVTVYRYRNAEELRGACEEIVQRAGGKKNVTVGAGVTTAQHVPMTEAQEAALVRERAAWREQWLEERAAKTRS